MLKTGDRAPDFTLARDGGGQVTLSALRPGGVVLYFYPRDNTPACTTEAVEFSAAAPAFAQAGCTVLGVSTDSARVHDGFRRRHGLSVILGADPDAAVSTAYGVWVEKRMYGRSYTGIERSTFLIDGAGRIAQIWRAVRVPGHVAEVLAAAQALAAAPGGAA